MTRATSSLHATAINPLDLATGSVLSMSATSTAEPAFVAKTKTGRITDFVDSRVGGSGILREFGRNVFPDHWSFMFGEVALYSFVILLLSGTFLTFFFDPSMAETHYDGGYIPLKG